MVRVTSIMGTSAREATQKRAARVAGGSGVGFFLLQSPIEFACFCGQSVLFSGLFNLFTFGPDQRAQSIDLLSPLPERVALRAHRP